MAGLFYSLARLICYNKDMKHTQMLREVGKFVAGLVAADLLMGLWLLAAGTLPQTFLGIYVTASFAWTWVFFDLFVLLVLVHYSWNAKALEPHASSKALFIAVGVIMAAVAIVHFFRLVFSWPVVIDGWAAPLWVSWIGVIVAAYISYASFHFASRRGK
jgi:hypothetical protein